MIAPPTRAQRQAATRSALLSAARETFLEHGYDGASLAAIAAAAGCTTGAVYASFAGKDALFAAVLDERAEVSRRDQLEAAATGATLDDALRAAARVLLADDEDPRWARLIAAYWARAAHDDGFRAAAQARTDAILDGVATVVADVAQRHGMTFTVPVREVVRGGGALTRGIRLERALGFAPTCTSETFEAMFVAYVQGLMRPATPAAGTEGEAT